MLPTARPVPTPAGAALARASCRKPSMPPAGSGKRWPLCYTLVHSEGDRLHGATRTLPTSIKTFRGSAVCGQQKCSKPQAASHGDTC